PAVIALATSQVDTAALFINCSPRLHDGYVFGLGSEMGIATGKLHARGPVGLKELTIYKWIAYGKGHIRK
ncbi:MAG: gamma-glutamyl-phosphate reductase, partial [Patescibacteria group bacterium]